MGEKIGILLDLLAFVCGFLRVCVGDGGSIRQHEHFYEIGPL